jgi:hypothetical protein
MFALAAATAWAQNSQSASDTQLPEKVQFNRDIRPILSDRCFTCHGPDRTHRVTEFHFDVEDSAKQQLSGGRLAISPGDPDKSVLIQRVSAVEDTRRMPPASAGPRLSAHQVALLKEWIQQGAAWEKPWAFTAPKQPAMPQVREASQVRNAIDNFVLQRLDQEGLKMSPEADRATLLRRVTLDLTGKSPTLVELDAFVKDKSPDAYEKVVDRLLKSPEYGERMALPWLDAARYADTDGYQIDYTRSMWRWRDWVISAFNKNMPFNEFAVEQIAGDLLPSPTLDQKIATGFNRNQRTNGEGGIIPEEFAAEYVVDRVSTTASVFLGVTMGCARCHDHKYDPFTQKEFYQLFAYFNNIPEPGRSRRGNSEPYIKAPTADQQAELKRLDDEIAAGEARSKKLEPELAKAEAAWLKSLAGRPAVQWAPTRQLAAYFPLNGNLDNAVPAKPEAAAPAKADAAAPIPAAWRGNAQFAQGISGQAASFDGSAFIEAGNVGSFDDGSKVTLGAWIYPTSPNGAILTKTLNEPEAKGYMLELRDGKLFFNAGFRWIDHDIRVQTEKPIELNQWHHVMVSYGGLRAARSLTLYVDGVAQDVQVLMDVLNESPRVKDPFRIGGGGGPKNVFHGQIADVRIYDAELTPEDVGILSVSKSLNELALVRASQRTAFESAKIRRAFLDSASGSDDVKQQFRQVAALRLERAAYYDKVPTVMVMQEMATPRESHVLLRGVYDQPGDKVTPDIPVILGKMPEGLPRNRLGLAEWLVSPADPLMARVTVNRFWQMYFGTGIVKTVDDFGSQGAPPSHPELLDWLATEFVRTGWNVKEMQRLIVTSATYRQSSDATPADEERDPENRLLARGPRFRLLAELIRDQALGISKLLVEKVGGPSVMPYQPAGLWTDLVQAGDGRDQYTQGHGEDLYRRSVYTFWKRTIPSPSLSNFDSPSRESCILQRGMTNSPLQALDLMNNVTYLEAARALAERMMTEGGSSPQDRIAFAFRLATLHQPDQRQAQVLYDAFRYSKDEFRPDTAQEYLKNTGEHPFNDKLDPVELAAYSSVASLILNMDETVSKE